jgi:NAD(P)-dependent dehydrogenase (short-subunit alcohol dehydrogenase family)
MGEPDLSYLGERFGLDGRVAVVTAARQGIGRAIAVGLARAGARVVVTARERDTLGAVVEEIGGEALALGLDVRDAAQVDAAVESAVDAFGGIDVLVNNAGVSVQGDALSYGESDWDEVLATNLKGTFLCCRAAAARMADGGRIVNLSSTYARAPVAGQAAYGASKAAIEQLTRTLALEWASSGVTVNAIAPGTVLTESRAARFRDEGVRRERLARIPLGRFGEPEDVVGAVLLLAGPAGAFVTGHTLVVDGGFTLT